MYWSLERVEYKINTKKHYSVFDLEAKMKKNYNDLIIIEDQVHQDGSDGEAT